MASKKAPKTRSFRVNRPNLTQLSNGKKAYQVTSKGTISLPRGETWYRHLVSAGDLIEA